jgi:hypothetical protein
MEMVGRRSRHALWRVGRAWCLAVLVMLGIVSLITGLRDGWPAVVRDYDNGLGVIAFLLVLSPGLLLMRIGAIIGTRRER